MREREREREISERERDANREYTTLISVCHNEHVIAVSPKFIISLKATSHAVEKNNLNSANCFQCIPKYGTA